MGGLGGSADARTCSHPGRRLGVGILIMMMMVQPSHSFYVLVLVCASQVIAMNGGSLKVHLPEQDDWGVRSVINPRVRSPSSECGLRSGAPHRPCGFYESCRAPYR